MNTFNKVILHKYGLCSGITWELASTEMHRYFVLIILQFHFFLLLNPLWLFFMIPPRILFLFDVVIMTIKNRFISFLHTWLQFTRFYSHYHGIDFISSFRHCSLFPTSSYSFCFSSWLLWILFWAQLRRYMIAWKLNVQDFSNKS